MDDKTGYFLLKLGRHLYKYKFYMWDLIKYIRWLRIDERLIIFLLEKNRRKVSDNTYSMKITFLLNKTTSRVYISRMKML